MLSTRTKIKTIQIFPIDLALTDAAKALPQMRGSGWVRSCRNRNSKRIAACAN